MPTPPIAAQMVFSPPKVPPAYDQQWLQNIFNSIARAAAPGTIRTALAATIIKANDGVLLCNGTFPVTLLPAAQVQYLILSIKNIGTGIITVNGTVDGVAAGTLAAKATLVIVSDGVAWWRLN